jgi:hypothetical protein
MPERTTLDDLNPHAFHRNLPHHHIGSDGVPFITKFAEKKGRQIVELVFSIQLKECLFVHDADDLEAADDQMEEDDADGEDEDGHALPHNYNLVRWWDSLSLSMSLHMLQRHRTTRCSRLTIDIGTFLI